MSSDSTQDEDELLHALFEESFEEESEVLKDNPFFDSLREDEKRYSDYTLIASGGMKNIFKVFDKKTGRHVALARLRDEIPVEIYENFLLEARLTSLLEHPNIISVHDIGINAQDEPYFTMELKVGDSLKTILKSLQNRQSQYIEKFSLHDLLNIFTKICDAVAYAHSKSVIHLDLKPGNIQIGAYGEVLVCDWGLGKVIGNTVFNNYEDLMLNPDFLNDITLTGQIKGTLGFMAPEQTKPDGNKSPLCDIYSLGAILYSILAHKPPIDGSKEEMIERTRQGYIDSLNVNSFQEKIPHSLIAVSQKALALNPQDRYQSVHEIRQEIDQYLKGFSTKAENAGLAKEFTLFIKRHKAPCTLAFCFIFFAIIATSLFITNLNKSIYSELQARELAERASQKSREAQAIAERESTRSQEALALTERANKRSTEAMQLFEIQKEKAERVLRLYEAEKNSRNDLLRDAAKKFMTHIYKLTDVDVYHSPEFALDFALKTINRTESDQKEAIPEIFLKQKAYILFIKQDFQGSLDCQDSFEQIRAMAQLCLDLPRKDDLIHPDFIEEFFERCSKVPYGHFGALAVKMLAYDGAMRKDVVDHSRFVHALLKFKNRNWTNAKFEFDPTAKHLRVSGERLLTTGDKITDPRTGSASSFISYFDYLQLQSLDLSQSDFFSLNQQQELKIKKLNISNTLVTNLKAIQEMPHLQELIINYDQFPTQSLQKIPSHIKVTYIK
ncbi:protein kinase [Lentisphaera marina]|uniref:serine/threonine protein kinase n=1 Tax=Lentisphaera marina TaxID=1111041 RepID=UPI0023671ED4|nr:protein kinase [Lentisphaera marina]MDD7986873.1 protein kinase [Lentisphaera marina]